MPPRVPGGVKPTARGIRSRMIDAHHDAVAAGRDPTGFILPPDLWPALESMWGLPVYRVPDAAPMIVWRIDPDPLGAEHV
jgi:hypothetical protein